MYLSSINSLFLLYARIVHKFTFYSILNINIITMLSKYSNLNIPFKILKWQACFISYIYFYICSTSHQGFTQRGGPGISSLPHPPTLISDQKYCLLLNQTTCSSFLSIFSLSYCMYLNDYFCQSLKNIFSTSVSVIHM